MAGATGPLALGLFTGQYLHSLDPKRRLTIPAGWREMVGQPQRLFVMPGIATKCLTVIPLCEAQQRLRKISELSIADDQGRQFARLIGSRSDLVEWDVQGRIRIKDDLLEYAELVNQVVLLGTMNGFELWNPDRYKQQAGGLDPSQLAAAARYVGF